MQSSQRRQFLANLMALAASPCLLGACGTPSTLPDATPAPTAKRLRGLVILIDFPGTSRAIQASQAEERFRRLDHFVRDMSYGQVGVSFDFTGWHRMPRGMDHYRISPVNLEVDKSRVVDLIQDAIDLADQDNDFSRYDYLVVYMSARFQDYGMVGLCGYPGMLGWSQDIAFRTRARGQIVPNGVAIFTSTAHLGTLFHDSAHVWGGVVDGKRRVPCLYDHDLQIQHPTQDKGWENALINMGYWDPMSCHAYIWRAPPPGISSWTRLRLGWMPQEKVLDVDPERGAEVRLGPLSDASSRIAVIRVTLSPTRYILIENRQPVGPYDQSLPGSGVLLMHADDEVAECRHGRAPVRLADANPEVRFMKDAAFNLPDRGLYVDAANGVEMRLIEKIGLEYRLRIGRPGRT